MSCKFRLIVTESPTIGGDMEHNFDIHEVYYVNGIPNYVDRQPINICGKSIKEIILIISEVNRALNNPTLWGDKRFPKEFKEE